MRFSFSYTKKKVLQALRYHFIAQPEIRVLFIIIIIFDLISAILYYIDKIRPEPFLLGAVIWFFFILSFWYFMPYAVYKRSATFKDSFTISFQPIYVSLENKNGRVEWEWSRFIRYFESPNFFHLYFSPKSFFLVPKDNLSKDMQHELRTLLSNYIQTKK
ncbi:MAG: YcxB family protein [Ginsengibacter sp.]